MDHDTPSTPYAKPMIIGPVAISSSPTRTLIFNAESYANLLEAQSLPPDARACAQRNFESDACKDVINAGAQKNLCMIISRPCDARLKKYLDILGSCIEELPAELMWRARSPIAVDVTHIAQSHIAGLANIQDSQHGIRIGVTQAVADMPELADPFNKMLDKNTEAAFFSREQINTTLVHEIMHKLSTQHDREGQLLLPRSDWLAVMHANGIETVLVLSEEQKRNIEEDKNYSMILHATSVDALPEDQDEFLRALRHIYNHPFLYPANIFEIIAFSAQNHDLSDDKAPPHLHNPLHNLAETRSILRRGLLRTSVSPEIKQQYGYEFDGEKWQKFTLEMDNDNIWHTAFMESCKQKILSFEAYLQEQLQSSDQLQDANFVKQVVKEANRRAHDEARFAWARLSLQDQKNVAETAETENIDLETLIHEWIVQSALFTHIAKLYGFYIQQRIRHDAPQGFIAMTQRGSIVISSAPNTDEKRDFTYHRLSVRGTGNVPTTVYGALKGDARIGERLNLQRMRTSTVRHLVSFPPNRAQDATHMTRATMTSFQDISQN